VIAEIVPGLYDYDGQQIAAPTSRRDKRMFRVTFPMGRYLTCPLTVNCSTVDEIRRFLKDCTYVSDKKQFDKDDYWMPPEQFERVKQGDCDDFALWTWRQFLGMGHKARYVIGRAGKYGDGHAWVTYEKEEKHFLVEPLASVFGEQLPRLTAIRYQPAGSVEWDGKILKYFVHKKPEGQIPGLLILYLLPEWMWLRTVFWLRVIKIFVMLPYLVPRKLYRESKKREEEAKQGG
jgi:hypothetical protein